ncbi:MAG: prolyl oligopeptidase family serine peptidase [Fimbriimonadaceae bacterium]
MNVYVRDGNGRGRDFRQAIYRKMGIVEIDDFAAGAMALKQFPWADTSRVGIYGTSYGGYASAMAILRYPDLFHASSASSMVSSWTQYDTTYTERYMDLYENNKEGYERGSTLTYAKDLKGWLMIYYGTADDNTHPSNNDFDQRVAATTQVVRSQVGVDRGHSGVNYERMMEFFVERLVMNR